MRIGRILFIMVKEELNLKDELEDFELFYEANKEYIEERQSRKY